MWVHWRRSPLCRATFPPPLITPRTAWMPRAALFFARILGERGGALLDVEAIVVGPDHDVAAQDAGALLVDEEPIAAAPFGNVCG